MAVESVKTEPILDIDGTLARFGGDKDLFIEMSGMLLEDAPGLIGRPGPRGRCRKRARREDACSRTKGPTAWLRRRSCRARRSSAGKRGPIVPTFARRLLNSPHLQDEFEQLTHCASSNIAA